MLWIRAKRGSAIAASWYFIGNLSCDTGHLSCDLHVCMSCRKPRIVGGVTCNTHVATGTCVHGVSNKHTVGVKKKHVMLFLRLWGYKPPMRAIAKF